MPAATTGDLGFSRKPWYRSKVGAKGRVGQKVALSVALSILLVVEVVSPSAPRASANGGVILPVLDGSAAVGETLSVSLNDWEGREVEYTWFRDDTAQRDGPGGTSGDFIRTSTYTLSQFDIRAVISVRITGGDAPREGLFLETVRVPSPASISSAVPTIEGSTLVGETLTADEGVWATGTSFNYRWMRNGFAIVGATSPTYVLAPEDFGTDISLEVTGNLAGHLTETRMSARTQAITSDVLAVGTPSPRGAARVGCQMTVVDGQWEAGTTFEYQWVLIDADGLETRVPESFGTTLDHFAFTPSNDDIGMFLATEVRGSKEGKDSRIVRSDPTPQIIASTGSCVRSALASIRAPTLVSSRTYEANDRLTVSRMTVGQSLAVDVGQWPEGTTFEYTWIRREVSREAENISQIFGTSSYRLTADDLGTTRQVNITVRLVAFNPRVDRSSRTITFPSFDVFPSLEGDKPTISGEVGFGNTLTAEPGDWTTEALEYQWYRNDARIFGAESVTYTITDADWLSRISVQVTGRVTFGSETNELRKPALSIRSARSAALPLATLSSATPQISGTRQVGQVLTANPGSWTAGTSFSYQWLRGGVELEGETSQTYTVVLEDATNRISVQVTGSQRGYEDRSRLSSNPRISGLALEAGSPSLSGVAEVGQTLTVDPGTWTEGTTITYAWVRDFLTTVGTGSSYEVALGDVGGRLAVVVRGSKTYYEDTLRMTSETQTIPVPDISGSTPTISGAAAVNETLTAVTGSWTDGATLSFQWLRGGEAIAGATSETYSVVLDDLSSALAVRVTGILEGYNQAALTSETTDLVTLQVLASTTPTVSGTAEVGETLTAATGSWTDGTSFSYQWLRDGSEISGATNQAYEATVFDVGSDLAVRVSGSKDGFATTTLISSSTVAVPALTLASSTPTVNGTAEVGENLTAVVTGWTAGVSFVYQWQRDGIAIPGATETIYLVAIEDVGGQISVSVTGSLVGYTADTLVSAATTGVPELTLSSSTPSILGEAEVGQTLTAVPGPWTQGASLSYQWKRDDSPISGATKASYPVTIDDIGLQITVSVKGRKTGHTTVNVQSSSTPHVPVPTVQSVVPAVSGLLAVGETLEAIAGEWSEGTTFDYQWRRDGVNITGANSASYQLTAADFNTRISVRLVGEKLRHNSATRDSGSTVPIKRKLNTTRPTISGTSQIGQTLTAVTELWNSGVSFSYEWLRDGASISGATLSTYVVSAGDAGARISVRVTGSLDEHLTESLTSSATNAIPGPRGNNRPNRTESTEPVSPTPAQPVAPVRAPIRSPLAGEGLLLDETSEQTRRLPPLTATALVGGRAVTVVAEVLGNRRVQFKAGQITIGLRPSSPESSVAGTSNAPAFVTPQGSSTDLEATGFLPGSTVRALLPFANGLVGELPTITVTEAGSLQLNIDFSKPSLERPFPIGNHSIRILGLDDNGNQILVDIPIQISQGDPSQELISSSGQQPSTAVGEVTALVAGEAEEIERQFSSNRVGVRGEGWSMELSADDSGGTTEVLSFETNTPKIARGSGFLPGTRADIWIFSTPTLIGSAEVDDDGLFIANFTLDGLLVSAGPHTLQIQGVGDDGYVRAVNLGVEVVEPLDTAAIEPQVGDFSLWLLSGIFATLLLFSVLLVFRRARSNRR